MYATDARPSPTARLVRAFGATRTAIGAAAWLAPEATTRAFGLGADGRRPVVAQLFGARELALGAVTATASGPARRTALGLGLAIDVADALATLRQVRAGTVGPAGALLTGAGAVLFAALGAAALRQDGSLTKP